MLSPFRHSRWPLRLTRDIKSRIKLAMFASLGASTLACQTTAKQGSSQVKVIGGVEDYSSFPATVGLQLKFPGGVYGTCTGTIVRDDLILTAAHCIRVYGTPSTTQISVFDRLPNGPLTSKNLQSSNIIVFPSADFDWQDALPILNQDAAFVVFPSGSFSGVVPASISTSAPVAGDLVHLVGYGLTGQSDQTSNPQGKRFSGTNHIKQVYAPLANAIILSTTFVGMTDAADGEGDSGGALYNDQGQIIGITSSGGFFNPAAPDASSSISTATPLGSTYANINDPGIAAFIAAVMASSAPMTVTFNGLTPTPITDPTGQGLTP